jgi:hypothetical protein
MTKLPDPPVGLEYIVVDEPKMCSNCLSIVQAGQTLVRRDKLNRRYLLDIFPALHGVCLKCTHYKLAEVVAREFRTMEVSLRAKELIEATKENEAIAHQNEVIVNSLQKFIDSVGAYIRDTGSVDVEYVHEQSD